MTKFILCAGIFIIVVTGYTMVNAGGKTMTTIEKDGKVVALDKMQNYVTQHDGTEPPFQNKYWDHKEEGIYVDVVSGDPLFSSTDKFDSGTGWPSFTRPIKEETVAENTDYKLSIPRTEIRSANADSHLGHVFTDGPQEAGGLRYCVNSAALDFIAKEDMAEKGYGEYLYLFDEE